MIQLALALALGLSCARAPQETATVPQVQDPLAQRPEPGPTPAFTAPVPQVVTLSNGVEIWVFERAGLPLVSLQAVISGGAAEDPALGWGQTALSDRMLTHGAGDRGADAFAAELEQKAISLSVGTKATSTLITLDAHAERLETALDLLTDAILRPRFDADEVERVRKITLGDLDSALDTPQSLAVWAGQRVYWGETHPLGHPIIGRRDDLAAVTPAQLKASWAARFTPSRLRFVVTGAVTADGVKAALEARFGAWKAAGAAPAALPAALKPAAPGPRLVLVDNPGAAQSILRVVMPGWRSAEAGLPAARLGVIVLGGTFTSRLNRLLREERGYTYGAKAWLEPGADQGVALAQTAVFQPVTGDALKALLEQLTLLQSGVTDEEVEKARGARRTSLVSAMESRGAVSATYGGLIEQGLSPSAINDELSALNGLTAATVNAEVAKLSLNDAVVVVVGDVSQIRAQVEAAVPGAWTVVEAVAPRPAAPAPKKGKR